MKRAFPVLLAALLAGCAATKEETAHVLGARFIGQNIDALTREFGPPTSVSRMTSGETAYMWELSNVTNINVDRGVGTARTRFCKVQVVASAMNVVTQLRTEDASGTGGLIGLAGDFHGSICAHRLGIPRTN